MSNDYKGKLIVLVDDDPDVLSTLSDYFRSEQFKVEVFSNAESFFKFLFATRPDLIVLDIVLPDMSGFQICKNLRENEEFSTIPIIILSGQDKNIDKVFGLDLGADDYMVKPYSLNELLARVKTVLRRNQTKTEDIILIENFLKIDLKKYKVTVNGEKADLTPVEFKVLKVLCTRPGQVFTREDILRHLWGSEKIVLERTVDVHIRHIREKLGEKAGEYIEMIRGVGYRFKENS